MVDLERAIELRNEISNLLVPKDATANDRTVLLRILDELETIEVSKSVLEASKLGVEVNKLRKHRAEDKTIAGLATKILLKWKDIVLGKASEKRQVSKVTEGEDAEMKKTRSKSEEVPGDETKKSLQDGDGQLRDKDAVAANEALKVKFMTGNAVRDKCFEMLLTSLTQENEADELTMSICRSIEVCLWDEGGQQTTPAYKAKFRSKYLNLKDAGNGALRKAILTGDITPERFCAMTAAEMANAERRRQDSLLMEQNLRESKAARDTEAETDQFRCGRCGQRRTKYYQLQTRSADEPMTTFVTCINCGNRWKFC